MSAGEDANRSPLNALARMKPAPSTLARNPFPPLDEPRPHAATRRAMPTTTHYPIAKPTVLQKIISAWP